MATERNQTNHKNSRHENCIIKQPASVQHSNNNRRRSNNNSNNSSSNNSSNTFQISGHRSLKMNEQQRRRQ